LLSREIAQIFEQISVAEYSAWTNLENKENEAKCIYQVQRLVKMQTSWQIIIMNFFRSHIRGPDGFVWYTVTIEEKISCQCVSVRKLCVRYLSVIIKLVVSQYLGPIT
jgi:hypothetical protein